MIGNLLNTVGLPGNEGKKKLSSWLQRNFLQITATGTKNNEKKIMVIGR